MLKSDFPDNTLQASENDKALAVIVFFVYNRPWHTRQTLEALSKNYLADKSKLFIYSDGPKEDATEDQLENIKEVRELIHERKWCGEVHIIEAKKNKGLTYSIIDGIKEVISKYEKIIVLEDDILVSQGFLKYMNESLRIYENDEKVYGISGYAYPNMEKSLPETFFLQMGSSWGWGTWLRAWKKFNLNVPELITKVKSSPNYKKFDVGDYPFFDMLMSQNKEFPDTWDIQWYASLFIDDALFLFPKKSLSKNIGFDNSGTHCRGDFYYEAELADSILIERQQIEELDFVRNGIENSFRQANGIKKNIVGILKSKIVTLSKRIIAAI
jgi:GT2 family glycosyltransferase